MDTSAKWSSFEKKWKFTLQIISRRLIGTLFLIKISLQVGELDLTVWELRTLLAGSRMVLQNQLFYFMNKIPTLSFLGTLQGGNPGSELAYLAIWWLECNFDLKNNNFLTSSL